MAVSRITIPLTLALLLAVAMPAVRAAESQPDPDPTWHYAVDVPLPPRKGKPRDPAPARLWLPPQSEQIRGLILGHPPVLGGKLTTDDRIRKVAAEQGLGIIRFSQLDGVFNYQSDSPQRLLDALDAFADASGHPEIARVPWLTIGHSTSGIFARNVAYWQPDRVFGVVHLKSGNLHHHRPDPERSLAGVPFLAINGEFEEYGPEGGIREAYGRQTQWVMIREQIVRRRRADEDHLMSLVVHRGGNHTNWSKDLSRLTALFIEKAAEAGLPDQLPEGDAIVKVNKLEAGDGWLTDADLKDPDHAPAPHGKYAGDKQEAFWHLDRELAEAIHAYHHDAFDKPDPSRDHPVPDDWP